MGTFLPVLTVVQRLILSRQPDALHNLPSVRKRRICGAARGRARRSLAVGVKPRADKQIKCGTAGEDRRESFKQISTHVEAREGSSCFHAQDPQNPFFFSFFGCILHV